MITNALVPLGLLGSLLLGVTATCAQSTGFTYQGALADGPSPATGTYDFQFLVFDSATDGTQVGTTTQVPGVWVTDGLFTAHLDPGPDVFTGQPRWLQINVRTNGAPAFESIAPRHLLAATPYALHAGSAAVAQSVPANGLVGVLPPTALPATVITNGSSGVALSGVFTGDGSGLTGLGAPRWVEGSNVAAAPGEPLVVGGTIPSTLILPTHAPQGARISVYGTGSGGWHLRGNIVDHAVAADWVPRLSAGNWRRVASSADGTHLGVAPALGPIHISTDGGVTWTPRGPSTSWTALSCSVDGSRWVASGSGGVYRSSDGGTTWSASTTVVSAMFHSLVSSDNGSIVYGADSGTLLYRSLDYGATWESFLLNDPSRPLNGIATSADGQSLAGVGGGREFVRFAFLGAFLGGTLFGGPQNWTSVSSSANGDRLLASVGFFRTEEPDLGGSTIQPGSLFVSWDGGVNWSQQGPAGFWMRTACSPDGSRLFATEASGRLWVSVDGGLNWAAHGPSFSNWYDLICTRDGLGLVAIVAGSDGSPVVQTLMNWSGGAGDFAELIHTGNGLWQPATPAALDASRLLDGTLPDARLSLNVALRAGGNSFTGNQTVTGNLSVTGTITATAYSGSGTGLTGVAQLTGGNLFTGNQSVTAGNLGLGTASPATGLHVKQRTDNSGFAAANDGIRLESVTGHYWGLQTQAGGDLVFDSGLGTGYAYLSVNGGNIHITSDARLKKNVRPLESLLDRALRLEPVTFQYQTAPDDSRPIVGFIAQQVRPLFPEVVDEKDGYLALSYAGFGPIAIGALRELHAKFEADHAALGRKLAARDAEIAELRNRLERIERTLATGSRGGIQ